MVHGSLCVVEWWNFQQDRNKINTRFVRIHIAVQCDAVIRYMSFVSSKSGLCSAAVVEILCVIPWHIAPRFNDTALYISQWHLFNPIAIRRQSLMIYIALIVLQTTPKIMLVVAWFILQSTMALDIPSEMKSMSSRFVWPEDHICYMLSQMGAMYILIWD